MRYSKGWAILNEACMRTTRREISEGLVAMNIGGELMLAF
jgi:hypothetical protein